MLTPTLLVILLNVVTFDPTALYQIAGFILLVCSVVGTYFKLVNRVDSETKNSETRDALIAQQFQSLKDDHTKLEAKVALGQDKVEQKINELENRMEQRHTELSQKVDNMPGEIAAIFKNLMGKN